MTKDERHEKFNALFDSIPLEKNADKIREVCRILYCAPITVRQWRMKNPPRVPSEKLVRILQRELGAIDTSAAPAQN